MVQLSDVLLLNETALNGKRKVKLKSYFSFCKNCVVSKYLRPNTVKVGEGREGDEYIITRLNHVNIVNIYGDQECRSTKEHILESWMRLNDDLEII